MKIIHQITAFALTALVGFAHLCSYLPVNGHPAAVSLLKTDGSFPQLDVKKPANLAANEQRSQSQLFQVKGKTSVPVNPSACPFRAHLPEVGYLKDLSYYLFSRLLITGLERSDIIFPFHTFW